ncbi:hypothetical protein, partial [Faecalibaculum rodentium]|uniref:hypothetical protein n=1 Tax=Faecalibaculum rodentium TaxID=1702221 RepID=UPI0023EF68C2
MSDTMSFTLSVNPSCSNEQALASDLQSQNKCLFKVPYSVVSVSGAAGVSLPAPAGCVPAALSGS